jgi:hypothetical protein
VNRGTSLGSPLLQPSRRPDLLSARLPDIMPSKSGLTMLVFNFISLLFTLPASAVLLDNPANLVTKDFDYVIVGGMFEGTYQSLVS